MVSALYTTHLGGGGRELYICGLCLIYNTPRGGGGGFISVVSALYTTHLGGEGRELYVCGLCLMYNTPRGGEGALYLWSLPYIQHT